MKWHIVIWFLYMIFSQSVLAQKGGLLETHGLETIRDDSLRRLALTLAENQVDINISDSSMVRELIALNNVEIINFFIKNFYRETYTTAFTKYSKKNGRLKANCPGDMELTYEVIRALFVNCKNQEVYNSEEITTYIELPNGEMLPKRAKLSGPSHPTLDRNYNYIGLLLCYYNMERPIKEFHKLEGIYSDELNDVTLRILESAEEKYTGNVFALRQIDEFRRFVKNY